MHSKISFTRNVSNGLVTALLVTTMALSAHGADIDPAESPSAGIASFPDATTPLMFAAFHGHGQVVDTLIDAGANPDATNGAGMTALMYAAIGGHAGMAERLIEHGANPNLGIDRDRPRLVEFFVSSKQAHGAGEPEAVDGTYTREYIEAQEGSNLVDLIGKPGPGLHPFAALWAAQFKAATGEEEERIDIIERALQFAEDAARPFTQRFQACYLAASFEIASAIPRLAAILQSDPIAQLREVAACALGYFESAEATAALREALASETAESVRSWISRAINGEITRPNIWEPAERAL